MGIDFPGTNDHEVDVGNGESLRITGAITVMCWFSLDVGSQNITFVGKYSSGDNCWALQTDEDGAGKTFGIFVIAPTSSTTKGSGWANFPTGLGTGQLHHLAGVYVPSTAIKIYQDGAFSDENVTDIPATQHDATNSVIVGGRADGIQNPDGKLHDARIYDRALSAAEIATIYASRGRDGIVDGRVGRWPLRERHPGQTAAGAGSVRDVGPFGNHGTPAGSLTYVASPL